MDRQADLSPTYPPTGHGFQVMVKPTGAICNLDCSYCYYLSKSELYPGTRTRMGDDVLDEYLRQMLDAHRGGDVTIVWQGGEPTLMGLPFFRKVVARADALAAPRQVVRHALQTNATLLDEAWASFLAEHRFLVGVSVDGPPHLHDLLRVDRRGYATSSRVLRGIALLRGRGVDYNVLCTVNAVNARHPVEVYRYLRDECGGSFLQFIPVVEHTPAAGDRQAVSTRSVTATQWGDFLVGVFDDWIRADVGRVFVQTFDAALASWLGVTPGLCVFAETCGRAVVMEHNGDVYSCDHFVDPAHLLGNIKGMHLLEMVNSDRQRAFGRDKRDTLPNYCLECDVLFACWGECPKNRFIDTPDGEYGLNYLCDGYKRFFDHIDGLMKIMAELVGGGRPASDVGAVIAAAPRNGPCPCGSERKAKFCHQGAASRTHSGVPAAS